MFVLDDQLQQDTYPLGAFPLSQVLLSKDANYPWYLLVPKREGKTEIHHLDYGDRQQLLLESCCLSQAMEAVFKPITMNIAALGNVVPQLHVHHIARYENDPAWPAPIWGKVLARDYEPEKLMTQMASLRRALIASDSGFVVAESDDLNAK